MAGGRGTRRAGSLAVLALLVAVADARALPRHMAAETGSVLTLRGPDGAGDANALTGDVNGDGIGDVAVLSSTFSRDASQTYGYETGVIHVVSGARRGEGGLDPALITILAPTSSRGRNVVVAPAGDVNGDGLADVLVGAPDLRLAGVRRGAAYVVRGGRKPRTVDLDAFGGVQPDGFRVLGVTYAAGTSVDGVGDVDGDGLDDIAVGDPATYQSSVSIVHGGAYVFRGGPQTGTLTVQDLEAGHGGFAILGFYRAAGDGVDASGAGDANGDGLADVALALEGARAAYVVFGRTATTPVRLAELGDAGYRIEHGAGGGVAPAGDQDGDGRDDLLLTSFEDAGLGHSPNAFVVPGQAGSTPVDLRTFDGTQERGTRISGLSGSETDSLHRATSGGRDATGDGCPDVLLSSFALESVYLIAGTCAATAGTTTAPASSTAGTTSAAGTGGTVATAAPAVGIGAPPAPRPRLAARLRGARLVATATCAGRGALTVRWRGAGVVRRTIATQRTVRLAVPRRARRARVELRCGTQRLTRQVRVRRQA